MRVEQPACFVPLPPHRRQPLFAASGQIPSQNNSGNTSDLLRKANSIILDQSVPDNQKIKDLQGLLDEGLDLNSPIYGERGKFGYLLHTVVTAVSLGYAGPKVLGFVLDKGANLYAQDYLGRTVAHQVVEMPFPPLALLTQLLKEDKKRENRLANIPDNTLATPFHRAARKGYVGAMRRLMAHGGDPTLETNRNQDVLRLATLSRNSAAIALAHEALANWKKS